MVDLVQDLLHALTWITSHLLQIGFYLKLADGLISWTSHTQKTIVYLSTEAEYMALSMHLVF